MLMECDLGERGIYNGEKKWREEHKIFQKEREPEVQSMVEGPGLLWES